MSGMQLPLLAWILWSPWSPLCGEHKIAELQLGMCSRETSCTPVQSQHDGSLSDNLFRSRRLQSTCPRLPQLDQELENNCLEDKIHYFWSLLIPLEFRISAMSAIIITYMARNSWSQMEHSLWQLFCCDFQAQFVPKTSVQHVPFLSLHGKQGKTLL